MTAALARPPAAPVRNAPQNSYGQILKSTSVIGGAQGVNLIIGLLRTKMVALLLGPSGVGLVSIYQATITLVGTSTGLGIRSSGVRQVAEANGTRDQQRVGRTVRILRRTCWLTGSLGTVLTAALAYPLSVWSFGSGDRALAIAVLGMTIVLASVSGGQMALIQGVRRISDLARLQILAAAVGTVLSVGIYAAWGEQGIVPVFLVSGAVNLGVSWFYARRIPVPSVGVSWRQTFHEARGLVSLGVAFMVSSLLAAGVALATRSMVLRWYGIDANGIYQAAWAISGVFGGFILQAMGMDFYPRLTAVSTDNVKTNQLVNEQTEVGILLAIPGLLGTVMFSPWLIRLLYSAKFMQAGELLPWFALGVFGRVLSWPLGYILSAKGLARWYATTEIALSLTHLALVWIGLRWLGLIGVAVAFAVLYVLYPLGMLGVTRWLTGFRWTEPVAKLVGVSVLGVLMMFVIVLCGTPLISALIGAVALLLVGRCCVRQLLSRLGADHRLSRMAVKLPWIGATLVP